MSKKTKKRKRTASAKAAHIEAVKELLTPSRAWTELVTAVNENSIAIARLEQTMSRLRQVLGSQ